MLTSDWTPEAGYRLESGSFTPAGECSPAYSLPPAFQRPYDALQDGADGRGTAQARKMRSPEGVKLSHPAGLCRPSAAGNDAIGSTD